MTRGKDLSPLAALDPAILTEVVREGETMLQAQFVAAGSADQRSLAWAGFVITVATALIGGTVALLLSGAHTLLATLSATFAIAMVVSAFFAVDSVRPRDFSFPGNEPESWLPDNWKNPSDHSMAQARIEQATVLNDVIDDNRTVATTVGGQLQISIDIAFWAVTMAAIILLVLVCTGLVK